MGCCSFSHPGAEPPRSRYPCWICKLLHRTSCLCPFCLTALLQWSVVLSYDKVWDVFRWKQGIHSVFQRTQKIRTLLLLEKSSDFVVVVHLQGLEPWAHWLRETNVQQSSIFKITQIRYFYRFIVNLCFASAASFAPVVPSRIRYPAVPVCKKCAKVCRAKISPLKQASDFYAKPGNRSGSSPKWQLQSSLFRPSIKCTSTTTIHGRDLDNCDLL